MTEKSISDSFPDNIKIHKIKIVGVIYFRNGEMCIFY